MYLQRLYLYNFRNIGELEVTFCPRINVIFGDNAQGKTAILEAIHFLTTGRSFRTSHLADMIRWGAASFYLEADFVKYGIEQKIRVGCGEKERQVVYNSSRYASLNSLLGILQGCVITPDDSELIKGSPAIRREFLDLQIAQSDPLYIHYLARYQRAMQQRNYLLRSKNSISLESWELEMADAAAYLTVQRQRAVDEVHLSGCDLHRALNAEHEILSIRYKASPVSTASLADVRGFYLEQWHKLRRREMELGYTSLGPHKDDLLIAIGGHDVRDFASEGQQRSCASALRFAQWQRLCRLSAEAPLMLLDDVGISLDESRRRKLLQHVVALGQVFLTSTQPLSHSFEGAEKQIIRMENGRTHQF